MKMQILSSRGDREIELTPDEAAHVQEHGMSLEFAAEVERQHSLPPGMLSCWRAPEGASDCGVWIDKPVDDRTTQPVIDFLNEPPLPPELLKAMQDFQDRYSAFIDAVADSVANDRAEANRRFMLAAAEVKREYGLPPGALGPPKGTSADEPLEPKQINWREFL